MKALSNLESKLWKTSDKIKYLYKKMYFCKCPFEKSYYQNLLKQEISNLERLSDYLIRYRFNQDKSNNREISDTPQREFTLAELATYDGSMGRPAYVAVNGIVYDVSLEKTWGGATHFGLVAGKDLTGAFQGCHGNLGVLRNLPKVGVLKSNQ